MENIDWRILLTPACIWIFIPIAAILTQAVVQLVKLYHRHVERMAMIERGLHPDLEDGPEHLEQDKAPSRPAASCRF